MDNTLVINFEGDLLKSVKLELPPDSSIPVLTSCQDHNLKDDNVISISKHTINQLNSYDIHIIESLNAGKNDASASFYLLVLKKLYAKLGVHHSHLQTESTNSIPNFAKSFNNNSTASSISEKYLFIFLSGDTSIFEFINSFYFQFPNTNEIPHITILPFPQGTGNALCHSLKIHDNLIGIKKLFQLNEVHLPLYQFQTSNKLESVNSSLSSFINNESILFMIVASWGLHSTLVYESDKPEMRSQYGSERFRIAAAKILESSPVFKSQLIDNDKYLSFNKSANSWELSSSPIKQDISYFLLAAVSNFEETFKISPSSILKMDELHAVAIPYSSSATIMSLMNDAYNNGSHIKNSLVYYKPVEDSFTLRIDDEMDSSLSIVCLDGSSWRVLGKDRKLVCKTLKQSFLHILS